jgi:O-antigen/teichoic acid export membrane protein
MRAGSLFSPKVVFRSQRARQAGELYVSLLLTLVLGIAVSVINTRLLGPELFGDFKFIQTIWTVGVLFVTLGLLTTGGNLLARQHTPASERPVMGSLLIIAVAISLCFIVLMVLASFPLGQLYGAVVGAKIRLYAALVFVFPFQIYLQEALRGTNDIRGLALLNVLPQLIYIPAALLLNYVRGYSLDSALLLYLLSFVFTVMLLTVRVKPDFSEVRRGVREIAGSNRAVGFHIYIATLITTATANLGQFTLAYFHDTKLVGQFMLALTITMPLTMIPNVIATTLFKQFASLDRIPRKVILTSGVLCVTTLIGFLLVIKWVVLLLYTERFVQVVPLAYLCAAGAVVHGMGDIFNRYLLVHGKTSALRSNAMQLGLISVVGYVFLVIWYGSMGAVITKLMVDVVYLATMLTYYRKVRSGSLR